jgi:hypothetical protein
MMEDYRSVPVEVLRDFARVRATMVNIRIAAEEAGLSHSAYHQFIQGKTHPQPRTRRLLALWYLARRGDLHDIDAARPYADALALLVSGVQETERDSATAFLVESLEAVYVGACPRWLGVLTREVKR